MEKEKTLGDFLDMVDGLGLWVVVWDKDNEDDPLYSGSMYEIPWRFGAMKLNYNWFDDTAAPIQYRGGLGPNKDKSGFVICVKW